MIRLEVYGNASAMASVARLLDGSVDVERVRLAHATRPEYTCRVSWKPGTLTVWDNRCTQHNAVNDYHGQRRRMRRITVGAQTPA